MVKSYAMKIFLASNSPRRKEILTKGNIDFTVVKSNYKEESFKFYNESFIKKNSLYKALDAANNIDFPAVIIGADTMVILREGMCDVCLLKPQDFNEAFLMLKRLSGKTHKVATSISLVQTPGFKNPAKEEPNPDNFRHLTENEETFVKFRKLSDDEIKEYLNIFKPFDKAGGYGIQDFIVPNETKNYKPSKDFKTLMPGKESFIQEIRGDYYNVMGMSLDMLKNLFEKFQKNIKIAD